MRQALSKAVNRQAIADRVMEGLALPASNVVSPSVLGHDPAVKPEPYDPEGAKKLLAEAGYPNGFTITLATPNNRYINDEQVAQAAAQMFSRIGVITKVDAMPLAVYLGKARGQEFSVALLGWGSLAADLALRSLAATHNPDKGWGAWNWARYSNPALDKLHRALARRPSTTRKREIARTRAERLRRPRSRLHPAALSGRHVGHEALARLHAAHGRVHFRAPVQAAGGARQDTGVNGSIQMTGIRASHARLGLRLTSSRSRF